MAHALVFMWKGIIDEQRCQVCSKEGCTLRVGQLIRGSCQKQGLGQIFMRHGSGVWSGAQWNIQRGRGLG